MQHVLQTSQPGALRLQTCTKTVMDTTDPDIRFDAEGVCNYWHEFRKFAAGLPAQAERRRRLDALLAKIKAAGRSKEHDCVIGLSGGVDSSYLASLAKSWGLRPLAVHFDNGWNSELAVSNIEQLVSRLGWDLDTFVMDWDEFRDVQRAYFKASVIDLEVPTDHMIIGALYRTASQRGIRYILSGTNYATEWLLPQSWYYRKGDLANLLNIHRRFGERRLKRLPMLGLWQDMYYRYLHGIESVQLLDYVDYHKSEAKRHLMEDLGWRDYGGKHYESVFTRFYQGYILPRKFGVDKRKAHLSTLILSGQMTREEAQRELQQPTYDEDLQQQDKEYVAKKLGFSSDEFEAILSLPNQRHEEYGTDMAARRRYLDFQRRIEPVKRIVRRGR
jgi:N-acetyl sugar amidotransferase